MVLPTLAVYIATRTSRSPKVMNSTESGMHNTGVEVAPSSGIVDRSRTTMTELCGSLSIVGSHMFTW